MSLTAFVLIALQEAKDICEPQVNVSVPCLSLLPSPAQDTSGEVWIWGHFQSSQCDNHHHSGHKST